MSTANLTDAEHREYAELMQQEPNARSDKGDERLEYLIAKIESADEPIYVAQTFDPDFVKDKQSCQDWFHEHQIEASKLGGCFARYSWSDDECGILFECWDHTPADQGPQRWAEPGTTSNLT